MYKRTNNACTHLYTIGGCSTFTNVQIMHVRICIRSEDFVHVQLNNIKIKIKDVCLMSHAEKRSSVGIHFLILFFITELMFDGIVFINLKDEI